MKTNKIMKNIIFGIYKTTFEAIAFIFAEKETYEKTKDPSNSVVLEDEDLNVNVKGIPGCFWGGDILLHYSVDEKLENKVREFFEKEGFEYSEDFSKAIKENKLISRIIENL